MRILQTIAAFAAAVVASSLLGTIIATQIIILELGRMSIDVPFAVRLETTFHDIAGMAPFYTMIVAGAMLVAMPIAAVLPRILPGSRKAWCMIGGFLAVTAVLLLIKALLGGMPIAAARGISGLAAQGVAGLLGGWLFARLLPRRAEAL